MRRLWNTLLYLAAALVVLYSIVNREDPDAARRPPPQSPLAERQPAMRTPPPRLPAPGPRDVSVIDLAEKRSSIGTAFAIADGWWLTARHVVDGCHAVGLVTGPRRATWAQSTLVHPNADLALLSTSLSRPALALSTRSGFARGQDGFAFGYPQGKPGDVHARYMGNLRLRSTGRYRSEEIAAVWAETDRVPAGLTALGGISGGPMLDGEGSVVGVMVATSKRRGRIITVMPRTIRELVEQHNVPVRSGASLPPLSAANYIRQANVLRRNLRVAQVYCRVEDGRRRPGRDGARSP